MKRLLLVSVSAALLTACGGEAENADVAEVETPVVGNAAPIEADVGTAGATATAWDANNNRMLDRNEFTGMRDDGFLGFNEDEDRERLTRTEFDQGWTEAGFQNGGEVFTAFDDNNDSFLEQGEFFSEDEFAEWDTNGNGILENNEFGYYGAA